MLVALSREAFQKLLNDPDAVNQLKDCEKSDKEFGRLLKEFVTSKGFRYGEIPT